MPEPDGKRFGAKEKQRIGEILVAEGLLSEKDVDRALGFQRESWAESLKLGTILLGWDLLAEKALLDALAKFHRCPGVDWTTLRASDRRVVATLPVAHAVRLRALAYADEKTRLRVAFANPSDLAAVDEVSMITSRSIVPAVATEVRMVMALQLFYRAGIPLHFQGVVHKLEHADVGRPAAPTRAPPGPRQETGAGRTPSGASPRTPEEIAEIVLDDFLKGLPRAILLGSDADGIVGLRGHGPLRTQDSVAALRIPAWERTVFSDVASTGFPHFGPVGRDLWPRTFAALLGAEAPPCAIFPIRVPETAPAFLYADRLGEPLSYDDFAALSRAAAYAAKLFDRPDLPKDGNLARS